MGKPAGRWVTGSTVVSEVSHWSVIRSICFRILAAKCLAEACAFIMLDSCAVSAAVLRRFGTFALMMGVR